MKYISKYTFICFSKDQVGNTMPLDNKSISPLYSIPKNTTLTVFYFNLHMYKEKTNEIKIPAFDLI